MLILHVELVGNKSLVGGRVTAFPIGADVVFAVQAVAVDLLQAGGYGIAQGPIFRDFGAGIEVVAGTDTDVKIGFNGLPLL